MKTYWIEIKTEVELTLDDSILESVDDEWREQLYDMKDDKEVAEYIAYNMITNGLKLSQIEGFADKSDDKAEISSPQWSVECFDEELHDG